MSYVFRNQNIGSTKATITSGTSVYDYVHTMNGINTAETDANSIMAGINTLYGIVGFGTDEVERTVKQNVVNQE